MKKVLNMETSNEEDMKIYKKYFDDAMKDRIKMFKDSEKPKVYNKVIMCIINKLIINEKNRK